MFTLKGDNNLRNNNDLYYLNNSSLECSLLQILFENNGLCKYFFQGGGKAILGKEVRKYKISYFCGFFCVLLWFANLPFNHYSLCKAGFITQSITQRLNRINIDLYGKIHVDSLQPNLVTSSNVLTFSL